MRNDVIKALLEVFEGNNEYVLLYADVGNAVLDPLLDKFPDRCYNVGISEQAAVGIAAGMCCAGKKPIVYSISSFLYGRALEQIKSLVCENNLPVVLVGVGSGYAYDKLGPTHHAPEDIKIMSSFPGMTVYCPADNKRAYAVTRMACEASGPTYIAVTGGDFEAPLNGTQWNKNDVFNKNTIVCIGSCIKEVIEAAEEDKEESYNIFSLEKFPVERKTLKSMGRLERMVVVHEGTKETIPSLPCAVPVICAAEGFMKKAFDRKKMLEDMCS